MSRDEPNSGAGTLNMDIRNTVAIGTRDGWLGHEWRREWEAVIRQPAKAEISTD